MQAFDIYDLPAGTGQLALCPLPGRGGDYAGDLERVLLWRPDLVLTMTESTEMQTHGAAALGADLRTRGVAWEHLPIPDMTACTTHAQSVHTACASAQQMLTEGKRVLVHCLGGCGRSGMVALHLMIRLGEPPETALTRLRQTRPCAVETEAQLRWARVL